MIEVTIVLSGVDENPPLMREDGRKENRVHYRASPPVKWQQIFLRVLSLPAVLCLHKKSL